MTGVTVPPAIRDDAMQWLSSTMSFQTASATDRPRVFVVLFASGYADEEVVRLEAWLARRPLVRVVRRRA